MRPWPAQGRRGGDRVRQRTSGSADTGGGNPGGRRRMVGMAARVMAGLLLAAWPAGAQQQRDPFQSAEPPAPRTRGTIVPQQQPPPQAPQSQGRPQAQPPAPAPRQGGDPSFTFVNDSNETIYYLHASPHRDPNWGRDHLGSGVLPAGQSFHVQLPVGDCVYDIRIVFENRVALERRDGLNLCRIRRVNVAMMRSR